MAASLMARRGFLAAVSASIAGSGFRTAAVAKTAEATGSVAHTGAQIARTAKAGHDATTLGQMAQPSRRQLLRYTSAAAPTVAKATAGTASGVAKTAVELLGILG